ncbi:MAG: glycerol-3-phosphate 1-O-acyltransferase PlsY [Phycisphaeraceae bacterium]
MPWAVLLWVLVGYVCGSVPFGLLIGRARGVDIRTAGSGNVGATNVVRLLGRTWGVLCFVLDVLKGLCPVLAAGVVMGWAGRTDLKAVEAWQWLAVAVAAVLGHIFPIWLSFKGGKGVATGLGVLLGFFPVLTPAGLVAALTWLAMAGLFRYVSLASMTAAAAIPIYLLIGAAINGGRPTMDLMPLLIVTGLMAVLVVVRHRTNLSRLCAGTEPKLGQGKGQAPDGR